MSKPENRGDLNCTTAHATEDQTKYNKQLYIGKTNRKHANETHERKR